MSKKLGSLIWVFISCVALIAQSNTSVRYIYDEPGRLVGVIDENNTATAYRYDAIGNLVSIERLTARGPVDIFFVEPNRGRAAVPPQPGTPVTIHGIGFSATPTQNQVTFNGVAATVDSSTATMIKTSVPAGATTGPVRVTSPSGMAASRSDFIVLSISVTVSPARADVRPGERQQFTAILTEGGTVISGEVVWSLNPAVGTIDRNGLYTPPARSPRPRTVTVTATSVEELAARATATINIPVYGIGPTFTSGPSVRIARSTQPLPIGPAFASGPSCTTIIITGLNPRQVSRGAASVPLTVTGRDFNGATALDFLLPGGGRDPNITIANLTVSSDGTRITASLSVAGAAASGPRTVVVRTPAGPSSSASTGANQLVIQ